MKENEMGKLPQVSAKASATLSLSCTSTTSFVEAIRTEASVKTRLSVIDDPGIAFEAVTPLPKPRNKKGQQ